jgi:hypothetical protein
MSTAFQSFGFGHGDNSITGRLQKFKGEKGKTYRLGFVWWEGMDGNREFTVNDLTPPPDAAEEELTPKFVGAQRHLIQGVGYVINKGPEWTQLAGSPPRMAIATIIVVWPLGKNGQPTKDTLFGQQPDVQPWVFGQDKYEKLRKMHQSGYPMYDYDVQADCEESQFQKFNFLPAKQNIFKEMLKANSQQAKDVAKFIIDRVRAIVPGIEREIGQNLTLDQLREKMGQSVQNPTGGSAVAGDQEVDNILGSMLED